MTKLNKIRSPHVATTTHLPVNPPRPAHPCPRRRLPLPTHDARHRMRPTAGHSAARVHTRLPHRSWPKRLQWIAVAAPLAAPQSAAVAAPHGPGVTAPSVEGAADAASLCVEPPAATAQGGRRPVERSPLTTLPPSVGARRPLHPAACPAAVAGRTAGRRRPPRRRDGRRRSAERRARGGAGVARRAGAAAATERRAAFQTAEGGRVAAARRRAARA